MTVGAEWPSGRFAQQPACLGDFSDRPPARLIHVVEPTWQKAPLRDGPVTEFPATPLDGPSPTPPTSLPSWLLDLTGYAIETEVPSAKVANSQSWFGVANPNTTVAGGLGRDVQRPVDGIAAVEVEGAIPSGVRATSLGKRRRPMAE